MAKPPDPNVQKRNIRDAWARLDPNGQLDIAIELFGPIEPRETVKEVQVEVIKEVEVIREVPVEVISEVLVEVPVEVIKEVEVLVEVPVPYEVIKEVGPGTRGLPSVESILLEFKGLDVTRQWDAAELVFSHLAVQVDLDSPVAGPTIRVSEVLGEALRVVRKSQS